MAPNTRLATILLSCMVLPATAENVFTNGLIYLPIYLGIASLANVFLTLRAWQTWAKGQHAESTCLVTLMLSNAAWCVPCFVQCVGTAIQVNPRPSAWQTMPPRQSVLLPAPA